MMPARRLFCFGLGYTAGVLADRLHADGWAIAGTARSAEKVAALKSKGIEGVVFPDVSATGQLSAMLQHSTAILVSAPPDAGGDPVLSSLGPAVARMCTAASWVGYLSTTGVYGDRCGDWVDEETPAAPDSDRGRRRVEAENAWLAAGLPVHIFRLPGIYGPGRSALDAVREGRAHRIDKPGQFFSRIHVDDIAATLQASIGRPSPGCVYNVADDEPAPSHVVTEFACQLLGVEPPPLVPLDAAQLSPMARSFYAESRRVANRRIKDDLGVRLAYPTYREGLTAIHAAERAGVTSAS